MTHEGIEGSITAHYGWSGLMERIEEELEAHGIDPLHVTVDQLAPVDNYHWHRLAGTLALARLAAISEADRVLDVGGGIGGPARQLAHRFGCQVTVLDLTPEYCAVGETLTRWTQLSGRVSFVCANALAMPLADTAFDVVWSQHASMNIPDKARLYQEFARVLRPGGRLALYDVLAGPRQPIHFPVPWAADPSFSFLMSPEATRTLAREAGFCEVRWMTGEELDAELEQLGEAEGDAGVELDSHLLNGPDGPLMGANMQRNSQEGRAVLAMGLFERVYGS
jgi:ubiquinone/menaquinone biosynthesis C-methylase UbiE